MLDRHHKTIKTAIMDVNNNYSVNSSVSPLLLARLAGVIALVVLATGSFTHYVNSRIITSGDPVGTSDNLLDSELLFRFGFVSGLIMETVFILYALILYKLLKPVSRYNALLMLLFALVPVPAFLLNQLNYFAVLISAKKQMYDQIIFYLDLHKHGGLIVSIFFGLWLFPLGYLIYKSGFLPKILGILLMIGCFGYLINFIQGFLFPGTEATLWSSPALIFTHISELALMLWLLIKGVNVRKWEKRALMESEYR